MDNLYSWSGDPPGGALLCARCLLLQGHMQKKMNSLIYLSNSSINCNELMKHSFVQP